MMSFVPPEIPQDYLRRGAGILKGYWWVILLAVAIATVSTLYFAGRQTQEYHASSTLVVQPGASLATTHEIVDSLESLDRRSTVATLATLPSSALIRGRAQRQLRIAPAELAPYQVRTAIVPDTNVIEVAVDGPNPRLTAAFANAVADQAIGYTGAFYSIYTMKVLDRAAEPEHRAGPDLLRKVLAAGLLGLVVGLGAALHLNRSRGPIQLSLPPAEKIDPIAELAAVDHNSTDALRAFARKYRVRLNPNKHVKPEKLLETIRTQLQRSDDLTVGSYG